MKVATEPTLREAIAAHREPFFWANPLLSLNDLGGCEGTANFFSRLDGEYKNSPRPFLLAPQGDAGIYPGESHWLIPQNAPSGWLRKHLAPLIAISDLFPVAPETVFFHSGDLGDIIAALPVIRQLGGGKLVIGHAPNIRNREPMRGARFDAIRPLLEAQPYLTSVEYDDAPANVTHDLSQFRHDPIRGESLAHWQARHLGVSDLSLDPWLSVPNPETHGKVIVARSLRYHNPFFPWPQLINSHRGNIAFVGFTNELASLEKLTGQRIPHRVTFDLLDLAQVIAGASLFIGNQSCAFWIAAALGIPLIQESWEHDPNSIISRPNARYTVTGPETRTLLYRLEKNL